MRAGRLVAPSTLTSEQAVFADGMKVRAQGFKLFQTTLLGALASKKVGAGKLAALGGYFDGPDAYYMSQVYAQARNTLGAQGVSGVEVPPSTYYLAAKTFDPLRLASMLSRIGGSAKLSGIHGVSLAGVVVQPANVTLTKGHTTSVRATADLAFDVKVQNQGNVTEKNVPVTVSLKLPGGSVLTQTGTIASITAGQYADRERHGIRDPRRRAQQGLDAHSQGRPGRRWSASSATTPACTRSSCSSSRRRCRRCATSPPTWRSARPRSRPSVLVLVLLLWSIVRRLRRSQTVVLGHHEERDVVAHVADLDTQVRNLREAVEILTDQLDEHKRHLDHALTNRAIVRYDAFRDAGGEQSASFALLDNHRSGVVFSAIAARDFARIYVKHLERRRGRPRPLAGGACSAVEAGRAPAAGGRRGRPAQRAGAVPADAGRPPRERAAAAAGAARGLRRGRRGPSRPLPTSRRAGGRRSAGARRARTCPTTAPRSRPPTTATSPGTSASGAAHGRPARLTPPRLVRARRRLIA